jgi:DNA-binding MarR family transcriptional regulator
LKTVLDSLRLIVRDLRLSAREAERAAHTTGAQLFVLQQLQDGGTLSLGELAERTMTDQSSVSVVVKKLVAAKLVARKPSKDDARRLELSLTPAGKKLLARCPEPTQVRLVAALKRLAPSEVLGLTSGLSALVREMGLESESPGMFFEQADDESGVVARARGGRQVRRR